MNIYSILALVFATMTKVTAPKNNETSKATIDMVTKMLHLTEIPLTAK
jgi:hypothetical protein